MIMPGVRMMGRKALFEGGLDSRACYSFGLSREGPA